MDSEEYQALAVIAQTSKASLNHFSHYVVEMGLIGTHVLSDKEFIKLGIAVRAVKRRVNWLWADWLVAAYHRWGENAPQIIGLYGEYSPKTINDYINLAKRDYPLPSRKWKLSVSHYREVRTLPHAAQVLLLGLAEQNKWGASITLRNEVKRLREKTEPIVPSPTDSNGDESLDEKGTETSLDDEDAENYSVKWGIETGGDKNQIANQLALFLQRFEYAEYGYYTLSIEILKTGNIVIDNDPPTGVS